MLLWIKCLNRKHRFPSLALIVYLLLLPSKISDQKLKDGKTLIQINSLPDSGSYSFSLSFFKLEKLCFYADKNILSPCKHLSRLEIL